jgi:5-methyltetrahydrofolate--homocysteine methyltransferase
MSRPKAFIDRLKSGEVFISDGATGTMLQKMGLKPGQAPEAWVLNEPDKIRELHRGYVEAGSDIILTCSFGGNRFRLQGHGLGDRVAEVNRRAAEIAREVAGDHIFVAGDMGPTGQLLKPMGTLTPEEATEAYAEQARGLMEGGVDFFLVETMSDLTEAIAAIKGASLAGNLPIFCSFSFDSHGRTMMGVKPETVAEKISPMVVGIGANCGKEPLEYLGFMTAMKNVAPEMILWAKPNAGLPRMEEEGIIYDAVPEMMAEVAGALRNAGAQIIGGCCGTTPAHIHAIRGAVKGERECR